MSSHIKFLCALHLSSLCIHYNVEWLKLLLLVDVELGNKIVMLADDLLTFVLMFFENGDYYWVEEVWDLNFIVFPVFWQFLIFGLYFRVFSALSAFCNCNVLINLEE